MDRFTRHISRCLIAGIVALLPIGGTVLAVGYMEATIAASGLKDEPYYFPGLGLIAVAVIIYLIGLVVSTFVGRWVWSAADRLLDRVPAVGSLYQTLKQILGYGEGEDAIFQRVVLVPSRDCDAREMGLVTNSLTGHDGAQKLIVFVPGSPNPAQGRMLMIDEGLAIPIDMAVSDTLKALVSIGKTSITLDHVTSS